MSDKGKIINRYNVRDSSVFTGTIPLMLLL